MSTFIKFATELVAKNDDRLFNYGPDEQVGMVLKAMTRISRVAPLTPVIDTDIGLAGFGTAPVLYVAEDNDQRHEYLLLSDVAEALGWFMPRAHNFAEKMAGFDLEEQRREDEERGDGRVGWNHMRYYVRLDVDLIVDDPEAKADAGGKRWSDYSDWLVSRDVLPALLSASPWSREFMDNTMPAFGHAMREIWGDKLKGIQTVHADGTPTGGNAYDDLFRTGGMSKGEAQRRARRGPALDEGNSG